MNIVRMALRMTGLQVIPHSVADYKELEEVFNGLSTEEQKLSLQLYRSFMALHGKGVKLGTLYEIATEFTANEEIRFPDMQHPYQPPTFSDEQINGYPTIREPKDLNQKT